MTRCPTEQRKDIRDADAGGEFYDRKQRFAAADLAFRAALNGTAPAPRGLIWRQNFVTTPQAPDGANTAQMRSRLALIAEQNERVDSLRTDRDPCPKCGVRRDVGCKHVRAA